ncbi:hypothetical protein BCR37DRAFT_67204 [Protomyces lactucae-debilis]|uniref:Rhodopsin domain-containing protein n=1 Tax=Protomyces lactucae-debilis TaxID=2754530 RepID=A0A1Y2F904_PROLT|nr:uncharacterized protein BCR37DRAFT_67204 [Protomyces lactucae-debilis]ORY80390.1 hypothetical protein BCR37DRAFT_67204 [Protomyces lactucae-debilis]
MVLNSIQITDLSVSVILSALSTFVVGLRLYDRRAKGHRYGVDDYTVMCALFAGWLWTISTVVWISTYSLGTTNKLAMSVFHDYQINSYVNRLFYAIAFDLAKIAIVLFYTKLCDKSMHPRYWRFLQFVLGFTIFKFVLHFFVLAISCVPVSDFWNPLSDRSNCLNATQASIIVNVFTFLCELFLVVAPIPFLWMAGLSFRQKFALCCMFNLAVLIIIASALKLRSVIRSTRITPAYELAIAHVWSAVEWNMALLVAAILPLKSRLENGFKRFKRKFSNHSGGLDVPASLRSPVMSKQVSYEEAKLSGDVPGSAGGCSDRRKSQHSFGSVSRIDREVAQLSAYEFLHQPIPEDFDVERQVYVKPIPAPLALPLAKGAPIPTFGNRSTTLPPDNFQEGADLPGLKSADLKRFAAELATLSTPSESPAPSRQARHSSSLPSIALPRLSIPSVSAIRSSRRDSASLSAAAEQASRRSSVQSVRFAPPGGPSPV